MSELDLIVVYQNDSIEVNCQDDITIQELIKKLLEIKHIEKDPSLCQILDPSNTPCKPEATLQSLNITSESMLILKSTESVPSRKPGIPRRSDMYGIAPPDDIKDRINTLKSLFGEETFSEEVLYSTLVNSYWDVNTAADYLLPQPKNRLKLSKKETRHLKALSEHAKLIGDQSNDYIQYYMACDKQIQPALNLLYSSNSKDPALIVQNAATISIQLDPSEI